MNKSGLTFTRADAGRNAEDRAIAAEWRPSLADAALVGGDHAQHGVGGGFAGELCAADGLDHIVAQWH